MNQDERWQTKYDEITRFIDDNKRNPSKYDAEERGRYVNWFHHNKKLMNMGQMKAERIERFQKLLNLMELYRRRNQHE